MDAKISQFFTIDSHCLRNLIRLYTFKQAKKITWSLASYFDEIISNNIIIEYLVEKWELWRGQYLVFCCSCSLWLGTSTCFSFSPVPGTLRLAFLHAGQSFVFQISTLLVVITQKFEFREQYFACFSMKTQTDKKQAGWLCRAFQALQPSLKLLGWSLEITWKQRLFHLPGFRLQVKIEHIFWHSVGLGQRDTPIDAEARDQQTTF